MLRNDNNVTFASMGTAICVLFIGFCVLGVYVLVLKHRNRNASKFLKECLIENETQTEGIDVEGFAMAELEPFVNETNL